MLARPLIQGGRRKRIQRHCDTGSGSHSRAVDGTLGTYYGPHNYADGRSACRSNIEATVRV
jgi:hypothetical protein